MIVIYSLIKYIGGYVTLIGSLIIDSPTFDWAYEATRQLLLNIPERPTTVRSKARRSRR